MRSPREWPTCCRVRGEGCRFLFPAKLSPYQNVLPFSFYKKMWIHITSTEEINAWCAAHLRVSCQKLPVAVVHSTIDQLWCKMKLWSCHNLYFPFWSRTGWQPVHIIYNIVRKTVNQISIQYKYSNSRAYTSTCRLCSPSKEYGCFSLPQSRRMLGTGPIYVFSLELWAGLHLEWIN